MRVLLREGEDENRKTQDDENTPMHVAAYNGHYLIVKYLMDEKLAKHDLNNRNKLTPSAYLWERI